MASEVTVLTPSRRFRGAAIWCDLKRGDFFAAKIQRAILRPGSLALEFERDGRQYDASLRVALRETPGQVFDGPWQAKWNAGRKPAQESGRAECQLKPPGTIWKKLARPDGPSHPDGLAFLGTWLEDGVDWCWVAELIPAEAPAAQE